MSTWRVEHDLSMISFPPRGLEVLWGSLPSLYKMKVTLLRCAGSLAVRARVTRCGQQAVRSASGMATPVPN